MSVLDRTEIHFWDSSYASVGEAQRKLLAAQEALAASQARAAFCRRTIARKVMVQKATEMLKQHAGFVISRSGWVQYWEGELANRHPTKREEGL